MKRPTFEALRDDCSKWLELFTAEYGYCQAVLDEQPSD